MDSALENAMTSVAYGRYARADKMAQEAEAEDDKQEFTLTYSGYRGGSHWGQLPNGGQVPLQLTTNGAIEIGAVLVGSIGAGGKLFVTAMPR